MKQILLITAGAIVTVTVIILGFTYSQVNQERLGLSADLQYRTRVLADSLTESVGPNFVNNSTTTLQRIVDRFTDNERIMGIAIFNSRGIPLATSKEMSERVTENPDFIFTALDKGESVGIFEEVNGVSSYLFAMPLFEKRSAVSGALVIVQNASYIGEAAGEIWQRNLIRLIAYLVVFSLAIVAFVYLVLYKTIKKFAEGIKYARVSKTTETASSNSPFFLKPLANEINKMNRSLVQARFAASEEARMRLEKLESPWTADRLKEFIKANAKDRKVFVISNREPYIHQATKNGIECSIPASGMVTALEPIMEASGGLWIAHGSGSADRETADSAGKLSVPPDDPSYTLKRVWLTSQEIKGHYVGFSNEALWPLCHMVHTRPVFRKEDWAEYVNVNKKFADVLLEEIKDVEQPIILVQDFHLALLPELIKTSRPDAQIGIFWHVPWPSAESFSICPWRTEILMGMLGADIIGFHTQQYCNNFIDTVAKEIEARVDLEHFSITRDEHTAFIKPFPISVAFANESSHSDEESANPSMLEKFGISTKLVGLGVDRLDYTKGILERFKAIEHFLLRYPTYKEKFTFLQIAPISREDAAKYREYGEAVTTEATRINEMYGVRNWKPIELHKKHFSHEVLNKLYRLADVCLVTSLHDGMNLVAKEFIAARNDEQGALVLSNFTGASKNLKGALLVNPYSAEETAEALFTALTMPQAEQRRRMKRMRDSIRSYNVYRWSAEFIRAITSLAS